MPIGLRMLAAATALLALAGCSVADGGRGASGQVTATTSANAFSLKVGDCVGDLGSSTVSNVKLIPCDQSHYWEAYATTEVEDSTDFPGSAAIGKVAQKACEQAFATFVGLAWGTSKYTYTYLSPTQESWKARDRQIVCLVGASDGGIKGSLKGSKK